MKLNIEAKFFAKRTLLTHFHSVLLSHNNLIRFAQHINFLVSIWKTTQGWNGLRSMLPFYRIHYFFLLYCSMTASKLAITVFSATSCKVWKKIIFLVSLTHYYIRPTIIKLFVKRACQFFLQIRKSYKIENLFSPCQNYLRMSLYSSLITSA